MDERIPEVLTAPYLVLRRLQLTDHDALYAAIEESRVELGRWMPWAHEQYARDDAADFLARVWQGWRDGSDYEFAVTDADDGALLGLCGLNGIHDAAANMGYWVRTSRAGAGICTRAARAVLRFGLDELHLERISLYHAPGNEGSRRVALKVGFQLEGVRRSHTVLRGERVDTWLYSILPGDVG